ncbi:MAG: helix-turn-helix transcriptional regulator [Rubrivivax sp.]|jgi:putative molybdopterin biosynthesis protein|nr:helix-turn-helix transcriptional regulator [Rubrivivax sp.]
MKARGVHLQYRFVAAGQRGADVDNPLFDLLSALAAHGSIQHAAEATQRSYRHVWGELRHWEQVLGESLVTWGRGQPARLTPFAERLLWAEAQARARLAPHIEALRAELERVLADALDGTQPVLRIQASHDMALPLLRDLAAATERLHVELRFAGSIDALRALAEGRCIVAGFHVPKLADDRHPFVRALKPLLRPGRHKLIGCMRRTQGLIVAEGNPLGLGSLSDVAVSRARVVARQPGSGTRLLTEHLLSRSGLGAEALHVVGIEDSHLAVAAAVASGAADAGVGIAAAAERFGTGFVPLVEEDYYLVCLADALEQPAVRALRQVLLDPAWPRQLVQLAGYAQADHVGEVLALTRALPWWHFRAPRRHAPG